MDVVVICNGLGNQMSQYAFFLKKRSIKPSTRFIFDRRSLGTHNGYELGRIFDIEYKESFLDKVLFYIFRFLSINRLPALSRRLFKVLKICGIELILEPANYDFEQTFLRPAKGLNFYYGGWHSEKYFIDIKPLILNVFKFKKVEHDELLENMLSCIRKTNSVSLHVRRGDFLTGANLEVYGAVCTKDYFLAAIKKIKERVNNPHFFVFSNDVDWVRENLIEENITLVDFNKGKDSWKDMYLMSNCKHNINSNSTFSWWGAWLNANSTKLVIVPKFYLNNIVTNDFYPPDWIRITDY